MLHDSHGLAGRSGAFRQSGVSRQVRCSRIAGGSGAPSYSQGFAGRSGASILAGGSGAPRQSWASRQVRYF